MDIKLLAQKLSEATIASIRRTELLSGKALPAELRSGLKELLTDLMKNKTIAQEMIKILEEKKRIVEDEDKYKEKHEMIKRLEGEKQKMMKKIKEEKKVLKAEDEYNVTRLARLEGDIFAQADEIGTLKADVKDLQTQLAVTQKELIETQDKLAKTQNELVETRNNLTSKQEETQKEVVELRQIVNQLMKK